MVESVGIVGGGIGGLATACYLADSGVDVTVFERNEQLGGRASVLERDGFTFDMGPSWYLMPDVFERFFDHFDRSPEEFYSLERLDPHYRVYFKDGDMIDVTGDIDEMARVFEAYERGAGDALQRYLERAERTYSIGMEHFVYTDRSSFREYLDWDVISNANGLGLVRSMDSYTAKYFDHPKLRQLVQYSLVFLGGSPSNTPALYNLMSHVDFNLGVYYPDGGMGSVVDALVDLGDECGVSYNLHSPVGSIEPRESSMSIEANGTLERFDAVVSNASVVHTERSLLPSRYAQYSERYWQKRTLSPSAFLLYLGVEGSVEPFEHHTLVLPTDWSRHFEEIFDDPAWPTDPAYYICSPSRTDPNLAPDDNSAVVILVPIAPGLPDEMDERLAFRDQILADIATHTDVDLRDRIITERSFCVSDFSQRYNAPNGTALGLAHTLFQTGPLRPDHQSDKLDGMYFTGANTRPGIGVPMCLISGEHTANAVLENGGRP